MSCNSTNPNVNKTYIIEPLPLTGDTYVTGTTFASNQAILTRNDGEEVFKLSGSSNVTLTNPSTNQIVIDASGVKYFISETAPTGTLGNGFRWFNTAIGSEFVYILMMETVLNGFSLLFNLVLKVLGDIVVHLLQLELQHQH